MNEIDKKMQIDKAHALDNLSFCNENYPADRIIKRSADRVVYYIDQLKKCREYSKEYITRTDNHTEALIKDLETIEQRTKEACFKAGWDWYLKESGRPWELRHSDEENKELFKRAIDEAKGEYDYKRL